MIAKSPHIDHNIPVSVILRYTARLAGVPFSRCPVGGRAGQVRRAPCLRGSGIWRWSAARCCWAQSGPASSPPRGRGWCKSVRPSRWRLSAAVSAAPSATTVSRTAPASPTWPPPSSACSTPPWPDTTRSRRPPESTTTSCRTAPCAVSSVMSTQTANWRKTSAAPTSAYRDQETPSPASRSTAWAHAGTASTGAGSKATPCRSGATWASAASRESSPASVPAGRPTTYCGGTEVKRPDRMVAGGPTPSCATLTPSNAPRRADTASCWWSPTLLGRRWRPEV